ncbi:MAG: hypothetical protein Q9182_002377 [Xanthomendoza sp. 2 TL-2023]
MALPAYRNLLRSARLAFQDDTRVLLSALTTARANFESSRLLPANSAEAEAAIAHAEEVAGILRRNIVQGREEEGGDKFHLRIHNDTERGNNSSIKIAGKASMGMGGTLADAGCCGGGAGGAR